MSYVDGTISVLSVYQQPQHYTSVERETFRSTLEFFEWMNKTSVRMNYGCIFFEIEITMQLNEQPIQVEHDWLLEAWEYDRKYCQVYRQLKELMESGEW